MGKHKMGVGGYRHLPVLKDGQPTGVISVRDLLRHVTRGWKKGVGSLFAEKTPDPFLPCVFGRFGSGLSWPVWTTEMLMV